MTRSTPTPQTTLIRVFPAPTPEGKQQGGNPAPITFEADALDGDAMRAIASHYGHEAGFILRPSSPGCDWRFRFFVPHHEMEMCGHATVGALWCLRERGLWSGERVLIETVSGTVAGEWVDRQVRITQPAGEVSVLDADAVAAIAKVLGIPSAHIQGEVLNASTSRVKTLVRLQSVEALDGLTPDFSKVEALCERLGSTGLYPYAVVDGARQVFAARQFPKSSGYPEDAATGIAAAALSFGLLHLGLVDASGAPITVRQGWAMGCPSEIGVCFRLEAGEVAGCWLGGEVMLAGPEAAL
ncbi:phenazine biosynthesis protein PhzF family [Polaromonas sp. YR568]|uniref:PhzF family phenazine biosynthesis protein n=1 Tax=Polaromonas sp. YR568 TaxID=1855301 RepID=UPI0008E12E2C|nr:PhzF family phenazine biosynthesis isomerase [Polaromonas sp. YR568]SFU34040.1 phenazine biosynthesis protein PhzF family [Polaromonas sp. YR568]